MANIIENLAAFQAMSVADLSKRGRQLLADSGGLCHRLGKLISALSSKAPRDTKSVQKYVSESIKANRADIPAQAWSVANCCGRVGEGSGFYSEEQLDKIPARWLAVASAIINLIPEAKEAGREVNGKPFGEVEAATHFECMAAVIRTKPKGGQDRLETLRDQLKPAKSKGEGEGGEGEGDGEGEEGEELTAAEIALGTLKAAGERIGEADFTPEQAAVLVAAFKALGAVVKLKANPQVAAKANAAKAAKRAAAKAAKAAA
jgi:hypothetical protein